MLERLLRDQSSDLGSEARRDVSFVNYQRSVCFLNALKYSLAIQRHERAQIEHLNRRTFLFKGPRYLDAQMDRSSVADDRDIVTQCPQRGDADRNYVIVVG